MSDPRDLERVLAALHAAAEEVAGKPVKPVSVAYDWLSEATGGSPVVEARITRATRTLVFLEADLAHGGRPALSATAVFRIIEDR